jgi:hypothetical protein
VHTSVGLLPDEELFGGGVDVHEEEQRKEEKKIIKKEEKKMRDPFANNKNPPIILPFRDDIIDEERDNRPQEEKTQQEIDAEALAKQKELFRMGMDNIIANDELFFIQLPSSLPIDMDLLRSSRCQQETNLIVSQIKELKNVQTSQQKEQQMAELKQKLTSLRKEKESYTMKKTYSANIDDDENIWTVPFNSTLTDLSSGYMGEMMVYKSGKVKLKLGDILLDVSPGTEFSFQEQIAYISASDRSCHVLGDIKSHLTCTPDIEYLLQHKTDKKTSKKR